MHTTSLFREVLYLEKINSINNMKRYTILGVNFGHDAGAAIVVDGQIVADVSEERFNRAKHSGDSPLMSIDYCLKTAGVSIDEVDEIAIAGVKIGDSFESVFGLMPDRPKPAITVRHILYSLLSTLRWFILPSSESVESGIRTPLYARKFFLGKLPRVTFVEHHLAHASCAYYTSNDARKMIIATMDGTGDNKSSCIWLGEEGKITPLVQYGGASSIGWFYSNVTEALGWWHGDGEGKTMGLAPYGDHDKCKGKLDGLYPIFVGGELFKPYKFPHFSQYNQLGAAHWHSDDSIRVVNIITKYGRENVAAEAQRILEEQVMEFVLPWLEKEGTKILATSGGVFLNVKLNQRIWMSDKVGVHYPYPNPGDAGLAVGAALYAAAQRGVLPKNVSSHLYWGPQYNNLEIEDVIKRSGISYRKSNDVAVEAAKYLADGKIVGWFQGKMECGPRALGNRSILMSPKRPENKDIINARVKFREAFRPFCPSMTAETMSDYLIKPRLERFMVTSFDCRPEKKSEIPAVVHVDGTLRPQTVTREDNPKYWKLINEFGRLTGTPVVLNTSLNVLGEPIICTPREAIRCFFSSGIDVMVLGDFIIEKLVSPEH